MCSSDLQGHPDRGAGLAGGVEDGRRGAPALGRCHHLAGALGASVTSRLFALDWLRRGRSRRVVTLTETGQAGLQEAFGLPRDWAERS